MNKEQTEAYQALIAIRRARFRDRNTSELQARLNQKTAEKPLKVFAGLSKIHQAALNAIYVKVEAREAIAKNLNMSIEELEKLEAEALKEYGKRLRSAAE